MLRRGCHRVESAMDRGKRGPVKPLRDPRSENALASRKGSLTSDTDTVAEQVEATVSTSQMELSSA